MIFLKLIMAVVLSLFILFVYSACVIAGQCDRMMENEETRKMIEGK